MFLFLVLTLVLRSIQGTAVIPNVFKCCGRALFYDVNDLKCNSLPRNMAHIPPLTAPLGNNETSWSQVDVLSYGLPALGLDSEHKALTNLNTSHEKMFTLQVNTGMRTSRRIPLLRVNIDENGGGDTSQVFRHEYCLDHAFHAGGNGRSQWVGTVAVISQLKPEMECRSRPCLRACCPKHHVFEKGGCKHLGTNSTESERNATVWLPTLINRRNGEFSNIYKDYRYFYGQPSCRYRDVIDERAHNFFFQEDGSLNWNGTRFNYTQYCVATIRDNDSTRQGFYRQALVCSGSVYEAERLLEISRQVMPSLYGVSLLFLAAAMVRVYCRPQQKQNVFGAMTFTMLAMLFCFYAVLLVPLAAGSKHVTHQPVLCQIEGFAIQFFYLSSMFWLNSMCVDVWRTFRQLRSFKAANSAAGGGGGVWRHPKYRWYALWSWGGPATVVAVTLAMQYLPQTITQGTKTPGVGQEGKCFLGSEGAIYYLHLINLPILLLNILLFAFSSFSLYCGAYSANSRIRRGGSRGINKQYLARARVLTRLFFVVGLTWIADVVSWLLHNHTTTNAQISSHQDLPNLLVVYIGLVFDVINACQGVVMFIVVAFDSTTITKIKKCSIRDAMSLRGVGGSDTKARPPPFLHSRSLPVVTVASRPPSPTHQQQNQPGEDCGTLALTTELLTAVGPGEESLSRRGSSVQLAMTPKKNSTISLDITGKNGKIISKVYHL